ncbi:2-deoxy-D-gluconate 3-dehydrogenase [Oceanobacillus oncorhynchi subsp. incaldanensis]|uniref:SDR family NAD(P)-dependent oxidoreductase n=1 Tax=Oceanobacillus oncorhynchi TaxID=545501 RepID=UPI001B12F1AC|nr:SDR family oxidoreductase [Oceanobacillus oncorhynchi]GIO20343.1 2-deoxy-D-gluconate 3-dehydrogenase [Oceanobacillus oncorhynchi subsp. incaldanensis]
MFDITGKKVIITGAAQGIGKALTEQYYQQGADIVAIDISDSIHQLERLEVGENKIYPIQGNLMDFEMLDELFDECIERLEGRIDVLVNCAGLIDRMPANDFPLSKWEKIITLNVTSVFALSRLAAKVMKEQGNGKIINFGSIVAVFGAYNSSAYSASKGAVLQLTKSLSNEWAGYGIQVNAIAPGYMSTTMNTDLENDPDRRPQVDERIPAGRWGKPEDVCGTALFLSSAASDYVTGTLIPVDGGVLGR